MPASVTLDVPMQWTWRLALVAVALGAGVVALLCLAELSGLAPRDALLRGAGDGERWAGVAVGAMVQPFALTALWHGRLRIDATGLHCLGLGVLCHTRTFAFAAVRRWGTAVATNRGRRERHIVFELHDGSQPGVKVAMYRDVPAVLDALAQRLGPPAAASAVPGGIRFDAPM